MTGVIFKFILIQTKQICDFQSLISIAHVEMMGLIGAGNNPMVGMTVAIAVAIEENSK